jgi:hypothetical protein
MTMTLSSPATISGEMRAARPFTAPTPSIRAR